MKITYTTETINDSKWFRAHLSERGVEVNSNIHPTKGLAKQEALAALSDINSPLRSECIGMRALRF
jgi:hypothetical protein